MAGQSYENDGIARIKVVGVGGEAATPSPGCSGSGSREWSTSVSTPIPRPSCVPKYP